MKGNSIPMGDDDVGEEKVGNTFFVSTLPYTWPTSNQSMQRQNQPGAKICQVIVSDQNPLRGTTGEVSCDELHVRYGVEEPHRASTSPDLTKHS